MSNKQPRISSPRSLGYALAAVLGVYALYFYRLGAYPLMDPDEPVYGQVAKEMASGAGWLTPHYNGGLWFDKPPLFYWLSGLSARVFGTSEFSVRLPSAILAVGLLALVYLLVTHDFSRRVGIVSAVVMATCLQQIVLARASVTDMTFVFCLTAALYSYRRWLDAEGWSRFGWASLCGVMTGFATLTKGPVAPVLLALTFAIHLLWIGRFRRLASLDAAAAVVFALLVGLPWYLAMYKLHGDAFVQGFLVANNVTRFLKAEHAEQTGKWYSCLRNIPVLLAFFFPWSVFLPQAVLRMRRVNVGARLAFVWIAVVFIFFSLSKTQLVTYIFPLYPAAALLVGSLLDSSASEDFKTGRGIRAGLWVALAISLLIALALYKGAHAKYPEAERPALILAGILIATLAAALTWIKNRKVENIRQLPWIIGTGMAIFTLWLVYGVVPFAAARASTRELAGYIPRNPQVRVVEFNWKHPSLLFYSNRQPERIDEPAVVKRLLNGSTPVAVICKESLLEQVLTPDAIVLVDKGGLVLLANKPAVR